ncbi:MAG: hypothetical protein ETSY2_45535, partial [Candidatus Entotheonella gemina]
PMSEGTSIPKLLIYLCNVTDNPYLKNDTPAVPYIAPDGRANQQFQYEPSPVVVDLHYMIVPYMKETIDEVKIVGYIKQLFSYGYLLKSAALNEPKLQHDLTHSHNESLKIIPNDLSMEDVHKIWGGFPNQNYKLSLFYLVTPVRIPLGGPGRTVTRVMNLQGGSYAA